MMNRQNHVRVSKFLSFVLRHQPQAIGLRLDPEGWALVDELIARAKRGLTRQLIEEVVENNDKQRFALSGDGLYIRANQGHSIDVDLGLEAIEPPETLFHGTATRFLSSIMIQGLRPQNRQYVHLSADEETAIKVGERHGEAVVLSLPARKLHHSGHRFYKAANGVWLTSHAPADFLVQLGQSE